MSAASRPLAACLIDAQDDLAGYYARLADMTGPRGVAWDASCRSWVVTSYELGTRLLGSTPLLRQRVAFPRDRHGDLVEGAESILNQQLMFSEAAAARRTYWSSRINRCVAADGGALPRLAEEVLEELPVETTVNLYAAALQPFASRVAALAVGLSEEHRARLYPCISECVKLLDGKVFADDAFDRALFGVVSLYDQLGALFRTESLGEERSAPSEWLADLMLMLGGLAPAAWTARL